MNTDVIIVGNGIASLTLSYLLKEKGIDHLVLSRVLQTKTLDLAETLPPSTLVLLDSLNLLELFKKSSSKTFGYHSLWNSESLTTNNFFRHNPYKYGLKLNKKKLLNDLGELVIGNALQFNNLIEIDTSDSSVTVKIESDNSVQTINGRVIVDATGRSRNVLKHFGVSTKLFDNQIAFSCHLPYFKHPRLIHQVFVETFENGWGIVSAINDQFNVMTLFTHKRSLLISQLKKYRYWKELLSNTRLLKDFLIDDSDRKVMGRKANSSKASQISGLNWLAIGDAAIAFDPLSSHGVSNACYCAKATSEAIESYLTTNNSVFFQDYDQTLCQIFDKYLQERSKVYNTDNHLKK